MSCAGIEQLEGCIVCCVYDGVYATGGELDAGGEEEDFGGEVMLTFQKENLNRAFSMHPAMFLYG